jgi:hypothetical protein
VEIKNALSLVESNPVLSMFGEKDILVPPAENKNKMVLSNYPDLIMRSLL